MSSWACTHLKHPAVRFDELHAVVSLGVMRGLTTAGEYCCRACQARSDVISIVSKHVQQVPWHAPRRTVITMPVALPPEAKDLAAARAPQR